VYNLFAFAAMIPLIFIIPRLTESVHPGSGGNPGFNAYDLDSRMRLVFYPAVIGWFLVGLWLVNIRVRVQQLNKSNS
jgi:heme exporter protein C